MLLFWDRCSYRLGITWFSGGTKGGAVVIDKVSRGDQSCQLAVNEQGVCVRVCVCVCVCVYVCGGGGGGVKEGVLQSLMGRSGKFHCDIAKIIQAINYGLSLVF